MFEAKCDGEEHAVRCLSANKRTHICLYLNNVRDAESCLATVQWFVERGGDVVRWTAFREGEGGTE